MGWPAGWSRVCVCVCVWGGGVAGSMGQSGGWGGRPDRQAGGSPKQNQSNISDQLDNSGANHLGQADILLFCQF